MLIDVESSFLLKEHDTAHFSSLAPFLNYSKYSISISTDCKGKETNTNNFMKCQYPSFTPGPLCIVWHCGGILLTKGSFVLMLEYCYCPMSSWRKYPNKIICADSVLNKPKIGSSFIKYTPNYFIE